MIGHFKDLRTSGYRLLKKGPLSSTFRDPDFKMDYDIYDEVGVSNIIYFDQDKSYELYHKKGVTNWGIY